MRGVRLRPEELRRQFGVSRRLAARVGALLAKGVEVSPAVLEIAGPGSAMEKLLLHPDILRDAEDLPTETVRAVAAETGAEADGALAVARSEDRRVLALEEECLAEEGWQNEDSSDSNLPTLVPSEPAPVSAELLDDREMAHVFTDEEIARLKLEALTGRNEESRISALRKLRYAPLPAREKGGIYLRVLLDPVGQVRSEAVRGLQSLGFDRDTADAIRVVFEGDARTRKAALRRVADLMDGRSPAELRIVTAVLVEVLRDTRPLDPDDPVLPVLHEAAPTFARQGEMLAELARVCIQHMTTNPETLGRPLRDLLLKLGEADCGPVLERLWEEIAIVRDPVSRSIILGLLMDLEKDDRRTAELCDIAAEEVLRPEHNELVRQRVGHHLASLGPPAAEALLGRFARSSTAERARLISFIDALCVDREAPPPVRRRAAERFIEALKTGDRRLRMEVLRARLFQGGDLPDRLRRSLIGELIPMLNPRDEPDATPRAAMLLEMLGPAAARPLFKTIKDKPARPEADVAARTLAEILKKADAGAKLAEDVRRFASKRLAGRTNMIGGYARLLGVLGARPGTDSAATCEAFDICADRLGKGPCHADLVESLGLLAAAASCDAERRVRAVHLLGALVERPEDEEETTLRAYDTDDGKAYELAGRIEFDSDTLPAAVRALRRVALSPSATTGLRRQVAERLLRVWRRVADWTVVWGPHSSESLALALGALAAAPPVDSSVQAEIVEGLCMAVERPPVVRALETALAAPSDSKKVDRLAVQAAEKIFDEWLNPEATPEELEMALSAAVAAISRPSLNSRTKAVRLARERTCELLFDGLRSGRAWAVELLERLAGAKALPASLRREIASRLHAASQVERVGR